MHRLRQQTGLLGHSKPMAEVPSARSRPQQFPPFPSPWARLPLCNCRWRSGRLEAG